MVRLFKVGLLYLLYGPVLWMGSNCLKARATSKRQFAFYDQLPRNSWYSFYQPWKDETHEITNHKSQKSKLFHLYYMKILHDKFSHQEKKMSYRSIPKTSIHLFKHFYFFRFISTQFPDFASLKIQMQITFAKPFNVLKNAA